MNSACDVLLVAAKTSDEHLRLSSGLSCCCWAAADVAADADSDLLDAAAVASSRGSRQKL